MATFYQSSQSTYTTSAKRDELAVATHIRRVHLSLLLACLSAAAGAYVFATNMIGGSGGILSLIATYGTLFAIMGTSTNEFSLMRVGLLAAFSFLQGLNLGPIISYWYVVDMEILVKALAGTAVIFASFTIAGLLDKKGSYMYLGGFLLSGLNLLVLMQFANIFFRSEMVFELDLYGGLMLFAGFVVYDTQKIMLKAQLGVRDYILDGLTLFLDVVNIFIRILRILGKSKKEEKDNRRRS